MEVKCDVAALMTRSVVNSRLLWYGSRFDLGPCLGHVQRCMPNCYATRHATASGHQSTGCKGAGAQPRLKSWGGPRFGSQHRGACAPRPGVGCERGSPPPAVQVREYHPQKICENSDAKSCILVTTFCEISCFLKTTTKKLGDQYIVGGLSRSLYGCCAYARGEGLRVDGKIRGKK